MQRGRARPVTVMAAAATALALATAGAGAAGAASTGRRAVSTSATPGVAGKIRLANGKCLENYNNGTVNGNKVVIATCSSNADQEWTPYSDGTIRTKGGGKVLAVLATTNGSGEHLVGIEPAPAGSPAEDTTWFVLGNHEIVSTGQYSIPAEAVGPNCSATTDCMAKLSVLTDPGNSTTNNTQLVIAPAGQAGQSWTAIPGTHFAVSALTNRPDSGGGGNWALDNLTRDSSITFVGIDTSGDHDYLGSVVDTGTFVAFPGNQTPNQNLDPGKTIGDSLTGGISGVWGQEFTTNAAQSRTPPGTVNGVADPTGTWESLFFAPTATVTFTDAIPGTSPLGDALDWAWQYTSNTDNCGHTETWLDAANNNGGQDSTGGDITAPAPGCP